MKLPNDVRQLLSRRFDSKHRDWLAASDVTEQWPLVLPLGAPTEAAALKQVDAVRSWVAAWRNWRGEGELRWSERRWRVLGTQLVPENLVLSGPRQAAAWVGELERWTRAEQRYRMLTLRWPQLAPRLASLFGVLADYDDVDFTRLGNVLEWLSVNPASGLYPRQLPIAGLDTKWLEPRRAVLSSLVAGLRDTVSEDGDFFSVCGLKRPPSGVRLRILDPALRALTRGLGDITAPVEEIAALNLPASTLLIVENLQTGLALSDLPGAVAFIGLGYSVDLLGKIPWIRATRGIYWGDIDTHGFAILHRARAHVPQLESVLMDADTMKRFSALWTSESNQHSATELGLLTAAEQSVFQALKNNTWGQKLRLEQERISWPVASQAIQLLASHQKNA